MMAPKHWRAFLILALVFAAGGVAGAALTVVHFRRAFERHRDVEHWTAEAFNAIRKDLALSPGQQPKIRAILDETGSQFKTSFGRAVGESGTNLVASWQRIDQELTPEQREIHRRKCQEFREGLRKSLNIELPPQ